MSKIAGYAPKSGDVAWLKHPSLRHFLRASAANIFAFPSTLRQRFCENQRIGDRKDNQNPDMEQVYFCTEPRIIGKGAEDIDGGVSKDTGEQAATAIKNRDQ